MIDKVECGIFLAINEEGNYEVGTDEEEASTRLMENQGSYHCRLIKITAKAAPPQVIETELDIPDEAGETRQIETEAA
jgi:hypothetical protein